MLVSLRGSSLSRAVVLPPLGMAAAGARVKPVTSAGVANSLVSSEHASGVQVCLAHPRAVALFSAAKMESVANLIFSKWINCEVTSYTSSWRDGNSGAKIAVLCGRIQRRRARVRAHQKYLADLLAAEMPRRWEDQVRFSMALIGAAQRLSALNNDSACYTKE